jgi:hypothetical protein
MTQLTRLDLECAHAPSSDSVSKSVILAVACLTGLQHLQLQGWVCAEDATVLAMSERWARLTKLTSLHLQRDLLSGVHRDAVALLSVRLAALASRLVPASCAQFGMHTVPLKMLPGGRARLDLACIGLDDSLVDERLYGALHAGVIRAA